MNLRFQMRRFRLLALASVLAAPVVLVPSGAHAQVIASTFGSGGSFNTGNGYSFSGFQSVAQSFVFAGSSSAHLSYMHLALFEVAGLYTISFRVGTDINTAVTLETWTRQVSSGHAYSLFQSAVSPSLSTGETYWIVAQMPSVSIGGWFWNDQGYLGNSRNRLSPIDNGMIGPWISDNSISAAYDVSVTPEPATLLLFGTGLFGIGFARCWRRRASRIDA